MSDDKVNGKEAGKKFLDENKGKDGVITLPSGLQYKVLREGRGEKCPKVGSPCECHYKGRLLDGTEFDSSYRRGTPTTFAPNQVIKGWTEAMQLMVVGDKWEMYIPYNLAYGEDGRPPKIPGGACLIFVMEILKIKGEAVAHSKWDGIEWTPDQLKLWEEKDEAALVKWREDKEKGWEDGSIKEKQKDITNREEFDAWMEKQCAKAKNKSLWKRTRQDFEPPEEKEQDDCCAAKG